MSEQAAAFPPGTVVRHRSKEAQWIGVYGVVLPMDGWTGAALVQWDNRRGESCESVEDLEATAYPPREKARPPRYPAEWITDELPDPPRAPEPHVHPDGSRILAPGVWTHPGRRGGIPCIEGRRVGCDSIYGHWEAGVDPSGTLAEWDITESEYIAAVAFEAGRRWAKERRKAKRKERKDG